MSGGVDVVTLALARKYAKKVASEAAKAGTLKKKIVTVLPSDTEAENDVLYLIKVDGGLGPDYYQEYLLIDGVLTMIGDTSVDLEGYVTKQELEDLEQNFITQQTFNDYKTEVNNTYVTNENLTQNYYNKNEIDQNIQNVTDEVNGLEDLLNTKVDKEDGKTLTSNDFTDEYKDKLDNLKVGDYLPLAGGVMNDGANITNINKIASTTATLETLNVDNANLDDEGYMIRPFKVRDNRIDLFKVEKGNNTKGLYSLFTGIYNKQDDKNYGSLEARGDMEVTRSLGFRGGAGNVLYCHYLKPKSGGLPYPLTEEELNGIVTKMSSADTTGIRINPEDLVFTAYDATQDTLSSIEMSANINNIDLKLLKGHILNPEIAGDVGTIEIGSYSEGKSGNLNRELSLNRDNIHFSWNHIRVLTITDTGYSLRLPNNTTFLSFIKNTESMEENGLKLRWESYSHILLNDFGTNITGSVYFNDVATNIVDRSGGTYNWTEDEINYLNTACLQEILIDLDRKTLHSTDDGEGNVTLSFEGEPSK